MCMKLYTYKVEQRYSVVGHLVIKLEVWKQQEDLKWYGLPLMAVILDCLARSVRANLQSETSEWLYWESKI